MNWRQHITGDRMVHEAKLRASTISFAAGYVWHACQASQIVIAPLNCVSARTSPGLG